MKIHDFCEMSEDNNAENSCAKTIAVFLIKKGADVRSTIPLLLSKLEDSWTLSLTHPALQICSILESLKLDIDQGTISIIGAAIQASNSSDKGSLKIWFDNLVPEANRVLLDDVSDEKMPPTTTVVTNKPPEQFRQRSSSICDVLISATSPYPRRVTL